MSSNKARWIGFGVVLLCAFLALLAEYRRRSSEGIAAKKAANSPFGPGEPIDVLGASRYISTYVPMLIYGGYVNTNLATQPMPAMCKLRLTRSQTRPRLLEELPEDVEMAVGVVLKFVSGSNSPAFSGISTGFFLTESGALVTCRHVLEETNIVGLCIMTRDGQFHRVREVLARDPTNDVVILQVEGGGFTPLPVAEAPARKGSAVWVVSHPEWRLYTLTTGIVAGYVKWPDWYRSADILPTWMMTTADIAEGSSGGPVLNQNCAVVGIASTTESFFSELGEAGRSTVMVLKLCVPSSALLNMIKQE